MKSTSTKIGLAILGIAAAVSAVIIAILWETPKPQEITISVDGTQGRTIEARIYSDGNERTLNNTIPAAFSVEAHQLSWEVKRLDAPEKKIQGCRSHPLTKELGKFSRKLQILRSGSVGASGLRRKRAWLGRLHE